MIESHSGQACKRLYAPICFAYCKLKGFWRQWGFILNQDIALQFLLNYNSVFPIYHSVFPIYHSVDGAQAHLWGRAQVGPTASILLTRHVLLMQWITILRLGGCCPHLSGWELDFDFLCWLRLVFHSSRLWDWLTVHTLFSLQVHRHLARSWSDKGGAFQDLFQCFQLLHCLRH